MKRYTVLLIVSGLALIAPMKGQRTNNLQPPDVRGAGAAPSLTIRISKDVLSIDDHLSIEARLANDTSENVTVYGQILWGQRAGVTLHILDSRGSKVEAQELDDDIVIPSHLSDPSSYVTLAPNHFFGTVRNDTAKNLFRQSGVYTIYAEYRSPVPASYLSGRTFWARENGVVRSPSVQIRILGK
jgi:uncharacterized protein YcfL